MMRRIETARRRAREVVFRVVYQAEVAGETCAQAWALRQEDEHLSADGRALVEDVLRTLEASGAEIDSALREAAEHWPLERIAATDRAVLRSAVAELMGRSGTPARVVLDEAIEIARRFGSEESGRFVNGVLDRVAKRVRPAEFE